jgi:radical SAM family RiPP maturation amino acid epimerase
MGASANREDGTAEANAFEVATAFYREMYDRRSPDELVAIARTKRFFERYYGDARWREALIAEPHRADELFVQAGLMLDPRSVAARWSPAGSPAAGARAAVSDGPLALWEGWSADLRQLRDLTRLAADTAGFNPGFDGWRERQARRMAHELGPLTVAAIPNALIAYELSRGCSVGCWFCGVSAERFAGHQPYGPDAMLWRGMLKEVVARFGAAAATGFCYWATDPCDNPDYLDFIVDHRSITGWLPQTTTADPFRSPPLLEAIFNPERGHRHANDRISVLTVRMLDRIHAAYTAEQMLHVDLVMQMKGSLMGKAQAGRARERLAPQAAAGAIPDQGSIACVVGFLVNLPERRLRMVTPCRANRRWPDGYRVFAEERFDDAAGFGAALDRMQQAVVGEEPRPGQRVGLHEAVDVRLEDGVVVLSSAGQEGRMRAFRFMPRLIALLRSRQHTHRQILFELSAEFPTDLLAIGVVMQDLFENGVLDEIDDNEASGTDGIVAMPTLGAEVHV